MDFLQRIQWYREREKALDIALSNSKDGLPRHELWRLSYFKQPYLIQMPDDALDARFKDIFFNMMTINEIGQITPTHAMRDEAFITVLFTQIIEEIQARRNGLPATLVDDARSSVLHYHKDAKSRGVRLFGNVNGVGDTNTLVKFGKKEHVSEMLSHGRFRISPASYYAQGNLLTSQQDFEVVRNFTFPSYVYRSMGKTSMRVRDGLIDLSGPDVDYHIMMDDYFLFSTCREIDRRMPSDFQSDSALIIKDAAQFTNLFANALSDSKSNFEVDHGFVNYFDPYRPMPQIKKHEFLKHFKYFYQNEHRIVAIPKKKVGLNCLEPFFIEIGNLENLAYMVSLN